MDIEHPATSRRGFMGRLAAAASLLGFGVPAEAAAQRRRPQPERGSNAPEFEEWLKGITGKHRQVFDATSVNEGAMLGYTRTWLATIKETYNLDDKDLTAVIILRHASIPLAFENPIWEKYKLGESYTLTDPATKAPAIRNYFARVNEGELDRPDMAVEKLLERGVKIGVCNVALSNRSRRIAKAMSLDADAVRKEWIANLFPGIIPVPSGVLAVHRAQEHECTYLYCG